VATAAEEAHTGGAATATEKARCTVCGKEYGELAGSASGNESNADHANGEAPDKEGLSGGAIAGIVIGAVAVIGCGGFALFWFVIKKKKA
jgi:hypothetical protein